MSRGMKCREYVGLISRIWRHFFIKMVTNSTSSDPKKFRMNYIICFVIISAAKRAEMSPKLLRLIINPEFHSGLIIFHLSEVTLNHLQPSPFPSFPRKGSVNSVSRRMLAARCIRPRKGKSPDKGPMPPFHFVTLSIGKFSFC